MCVCIIARVPERIRLHVAQGSRDSLSFNVSFLCPTAAVISGFLGESRRECNEKNNTTHSSVGGMMRPCRVVSSNTSINYINNIEIEKR
jgi:hypothetical protein